MSRRRRHRGKPKQKPRHNPERDSDKLEEGIISLLEGVGILMDKLDEIGAQLGDKGAGGFTLESSSGWEVPPGRLAANGSSLEAATNVTLWPPRGFDGRYL